MLKTFINGWDDYTPSARDTLEKYGRRSISKYMVDRAPIREIWNYLLGILSLGEFSKRLADSDYDTLFHLRMIVVLDDNTMLSLEKTTTVMITENPSFYEANQTRMIESYPLNLMVNDLLNNTLQYMGKQKFFSYQAASNNCQMFVWSIMMANNIGDESDREFVKQDVKTLFDGLTGLRKISNTITDIGGRAKAVYGTGNGSKKYVIQSIVFEKKKFNPDKAIKWLDKHGYKHTKIDETPNTYRFRQVNPKKNSRYASVKHKGVIFIIEYND